MFAALLALTPKLSRQVHAGVRDPFAQADGVDEIALARLADDAGDTLLRARLLAPLPREQALLAVRASPHARAPEALLAPLAKLACGRDPALAPEAARAAFSIAARLSGDGLSAREVLNSDLQAARTALHCADEKPVPRADIVALLSHTGSALDMLLR